MVKLKQLSKISYIFVAGFYAGAALYDFALGHKRAALGDVVVTVGMAVIASDC